MSLNANDINLRVGFDVDRFTAELQKTNSMLSKWGTGIQNQLLSAFSISAGVYLLQQGVRSAITSMSQFEKAMSEVKAITQATGSEFESLRDNAVNLAGAFKAIDIAHLESEFGRLGFSTREILDSTEATINLASATGSDLATSATIAGSTLRAFNLDAKEMGRVTDIMAGALNRSGLDMSNFAESIKYVAPVAHAAGISLEETAAMLGILADNGVKGSMAGTSLRRILTDFSRDGRPALERLQELGKAGITLKDSFDEVGRTAQTSLLILANNSEKVGKLGDALHNVNGEAKAMSDIMRDNLSGDWDRFTASIDKILQNGTLVSNTLRGFVTYFTDIANGVNAADFSKWEKFLALMAGTPALAVLGQFQKYFDKQPKAKEAISTPDIDPATGLPSEGGKDWIGSEAWKQGVEGTQKMIVSVGVLQDKIAATNKLIKESGSGSQIDIYKNQIEALELQIFKLLNNAELVKAKLHAASPDNTLPSSGIQQLDVADPGSKLADSFAKVKPKITSLVERYKGLFDGFHLSTQRLGYAFVSMGSNISTGLSQAIAGTMPFAQAMAQMAMSVVDSLERIALAYMIENSAKFGVAGIAAAVIGFTAIKTLFASIGKSSVGSAAVSSGGRLSNSVGSQTMNIQLSGQLTARGSDLAYVLDKQGYKAGRIGG